VRHTLVPRRPYPRLADSTILIVAALTTVSCSDQFAPDSPRLSAEVAEVPAPIIFVGAGDISGCTTTGDTRTSDLVLSILNANPTAWAFIAGDNAYEDGSTAEYRDCYGPTWGRFKARTRPSLGNHEYDGIELAEPSFDYFGDELWGHSRARGGYYSFDLGTSWHIVVLNSNETFVSAAVGSPQDDWLKADLAANNRPCLAAIWHHPRFFSNRDVTASTDRAWVKPFWDRLYAKGADLVLNGHSHNYERFKPQRPDGTVDLDDGIREFILGMGGKSVTPATNIHPNSETRNGDTFGVMELTLNATSYSWRFVPEAGGAFEDTGTSNCHNTSGGVQTNPPPVASFDYTCNGLTCSFTDLSTDDEAIASRDWEFGDLTLHSNATNPTHDYPSAGSYPVELTVTDNEGASSSITRLVQAGSAPPGGVVLVGAGDIAHCSLASDEATAKLLDALPSATVFTLGDNANSTGSASDYTTCYEPTWGRHKARTRPIPGYMDYKVDATAAGYFNYFGSAAGNPAEGYYSYNLGDWHVVALNSKAPMTVGSAQERWLRADLAANPEVCTLAYIARARFSSGKSGPATSVQPLWQALYEKGADIVLAASDHDYERFARQTPSGAADPTNGIQQFVVGTGGQSLTGLLAQQHPNSIVFNGTNFGVLKLTLGTRGYTWEFVPVAGSTFTDAGSMDCVGAPPQTPNVPPTADFSQACNGLSCAFTDASSDNDGTIKTRSWEFGDGATSTEANPTHLYAGDGTYTVQLTVKDDDNAPSNPAASHTFPVQNLPPTASFTANCTNLDCDFDNTSADPDGTIESWGWTFGDDVTSLESAPSHSYAVAGTYPVTLTATDNHGAVGEVVTKQVTVTDPPENVPPTAVFDPPSCLAGVPCSFDDKSTDADGSIVSRIWDFGDGPAAAATPQDPVSHTYTTDGLYHVSLTVIDNRGGQSTPLVRDVTVAVNSPPLAAFTAPSCTTNVACSFDDQSTDDGSIVTRNWDFGDGTAVVPTAQDPVSHIYTTAGTYSVALTVVDDGDLTSDPAAQNLVTVTDAPPPPNTAPTPAFTWACTNLACTFTDQSTDPDPGSSIKTWAWTFGDGSTSTVQNPPHTYASGGSKTVTLTVTDNGDKPSDTPATHTFTVTANVAPAAAFSSSCSGLTCTFTNSSTDGDGTFTSSWTFGDGGTSTTKSPSRTYAAAGTYSVKLIVTDDDGATANVTHTVTVTAPTTNRIPTALFGSACTKLSCAFTDRSTDPDGNATIVAWSWNFGDATTSTARNPTHVYKAPGTFKVKLTVTDSRGGTDPVTHTLTVVR
jgi:PKD repeat protein